MERDLVTNGIVFTVNEIVYIENNEVKLKFNVKVGGFDEFDAEKNNFYWNHTVIRGESPYNLREMIELIEKRYQNIEFEPSILNGEIIDNGIKKTISIVRSYLNSPLQSQSKIYTILLNNKGTHEIRWDNESKNYFQPVKNTLTTNEFNIIVKLIKEMNNLKI